MPPPPRRAGPPRPRAGPGPAKDGDRDKGKGKDDSLSFANTPLVAPPSLESYTNLHKLDLTNCALTSIAFVKHARNTLTWLNVSGNDLSGDDAWNGIGELRGLFVLNASNCGLKEVPSVFETLFSLKALVLSHNKLTKLDHVRRLPQLNTIVVSNNSLASLPASLTSLPSLKKLSAAHNLLTASSLPDLTSLALLREIKLNDNPKLTALPPHFSTWGKAPSDDDEQDGGRKKKHPGLEIVDLGNCGFEDWFALKELAGQSGIVNLVLKGNAVAEEELKEGSFEAFKSKLTILLPSLRILDNNRFDAKYSELKTKREARTPEQRILEAGPMMLAINAKSANPVALPEARDKKRRRGDVSDGPRGRRGADEEGSPVREAGEEEGKNMEVETEVGDEVLQAEKKSKKRKAEGHVETAEEKRQRKRERHAARREAEEKERAALADAEAERERKEAEEAAKPRKKRGRESKFLGTTRTAEERAEAEKRREEKERKKEEEVVQRIKKQKGGVLGALKGGEEDAERERKERAEKREKLEAEKAKEKAGTEGDKVKTSVLKVVEVKKPSKKEATAAKAPVDVMGLLGLGGAAAVGESSTGLGGGVAGWD